MIIGVVERVLLLLIGAPSWTGSGNRSTGRKENRKEKSCHIFRVSKQPRLRGHRKGEE
jgi:hypothetical protein